MNEAWDKTGSGVVTLLRRLASSRRSQGIDPAEPELHARFRCDHRLVVYGTLAPGRMNHHLLDGLPGQWSRGLVRGQYHRTGWGMGEGFPGFRWDETAGAPQRVQVFDSSDLSAHWARLDAFEGEDYLRILVPVHLPRGRFTVGNLYELRRDPPADEA